MILSNEADSTTITLANHIGVVVHTNWDHPTCFAQVWWDDLSTTEHSMQEAAQHFPEWAARARQDMHETRELLQNMHEQWELLYDITWLNAGPEHETHTYLETNHVETTRNGYTYHGECTLFGDKHLALMDDGATLILNQGALNAQKAPRQTNAEAANHREWACQQLNNRLKTCKTATQRWGQQAIATPLARETGRKRNPHPQ